MALALLEELGKDVDRLLWVGAAAARGDACLPRHAGALRTLGEQVPALVKLGERVEALRQASAESAPAALVQLGLSVAQVNAAQTSTTPAPSSVVEKTEGLEVAGVHPVAPAAVCAWAEAARSKKKPRDETFELFRPQPLGLDARLWPALVGALAHPYLSELAAEKLAQAPRAALGLLGADFDPRGKKLDALRVKVLAGIRGAEDGAAFARQCLDVAQTSEPVRRAAIEVLHAAGAADYGATLLQVLPRLPVAEQVAWTDLVAELGTPEAVLAGYAVFERGSAIHRGSGEAGNFVRALDEGGRQLFFETLRGRPLGVDEQHPGFSCGQLFLAALTFLPEALALPHLLRVFASPYRDTWIRAGAELRKLNSSGGRTALIAHASGRPGFQDLYLDALFEESPAQAYQLFGAQLAELSVLPYVKANADPRWVTSLLSLASTNPTAAIPALARLPDPRVLPALLGFAQSPDRVVNMYAFDALALLGEKQALPVILSWLDQNFADRAAGHVVKVMHAVGDATSIAFLEEVIGRPGASDYFKQAALSQIGLLKEARSRAESDSLT